MPNALIPLKGLYESVTRPIVHKVVDDVKAWTGLARNIPVRFYNETGTDSQPGSTVEEGARNLFNSNSRIMVSFSERYKEDAVINSAVRHNDEPYIFLDKALNIALKTVRSYTEVTITFEYRAKTRHDVEAWRNDIKVRLADDRAALLHEFDLHYEVPEQVQLVLAHLHDLRERQAGYGESLGQWFDKCFTKRCTVLTNANGLASHRVIAEHMVGVQGWFEFIEPEESEKRTENSAWHIGFEYKFCYQKPVEMNFVYPQLVHNQLIDRHLLSTKPRYSLDNLPRDTDWPRSRANYESVADMYKPVSDPLSGLRTPSWDEWTPITLQPYTATLATWLIVAVPEDPSFVMDLKNLGKKCFKPNILEFFKRAHSRLTQRGKAIVHFGLFKGSEPVVDESIYVDADLIMRSRVPMDLRRDYHVRLSGITELSILDREALDDLLDPANKDAIIDIWESILPELDADGLRDLERIDEELIGDFYDTVRDQTPGLDKPGLMPNQFYHERLRTQWLTIIAEKE